MQARSPFRVDVREVSRRVDIDLDPPRNRRYVPASEVMRMLGISKATLWRYVRDPDLGFPKPIKLKRTRLWKQSAIDAFLDAQAGEPSA